MTGILIHDVVSMLISNYYQHSHLADIGGS